MPFEEDSGVIPWKPPIEQQNQEIEQRRLIYGQFSTGELKRRVPAAFEPSAVLLLLQLVEARRGVERFQSLYRKVNPKHYDHKTEFHYSIVAYERSAEILERKVKKELKGLGYDVGDIPRPMIELAEQAKLGELAAYITDNSPAFKRLLELERAGNG